MNINNFIDVAKVLPSNISILMRGPTGIGKSFLANNLADHFKLPFLDVRGSTMSEGDVIGYPDVEGMKTKGVMTFVMPSWYIRACKEPVLLFLDELNRSLPGVQQAFFQIVLDRALGNDDKGNPYKLHPETRVYAAVNHGDEYDVNDMDPALLRRFWVCDIQNSLSDWTSWAEKNDVCRYIIEFIRKNPSMLRVDPGKAEPGKTIPCQASWTRLSESLQAANISIEEMLGKPRNNLLYNIMTGFVGVEASISFVDFVVKYQVSISPEDILNRYDAVKKKVDLMSSDRVNYVLEQISSHCKQNTWTVTQTKNLSKFLKTINQEMVVHFWSLITKDADTSIENVQKVHKYIGDYIVKIIRESKDLDVTAS